ncbi:hypothetical protein PybrP1_001254 [[Pythium] brassicae (nom. inval.)]|nr:hypothetical protein PybrP1_001254 [[Pythium] brassicae (nom. inval.)]
MVRSLPLRSGFFATPQLSLADENDLLMWGRSLVPDLRHQPENEWTVVSDKRGGVQVCEDRQKGGLTYSVRGVATVRASLDDVMELFAAPSTSAFRALMQLQLRECFADAAVLYNNTNAAIDDTQSVAGAGGALHAGAGDSETLGIKWVAMRTKKSAMSPTTHVHDFCLLEYAGILGADAVGGDPDKPVGVCVYESIEQRECPSLSESHRLERGSVSKCGYLFQAREEGVLEAQFVCSIRQPPNQRTRRRVNRALLQNWAESIICRSCSLYRSVELASVGLTTLRVCKACTDGTNAAGKELAAATATGSSASSASATATTGATTPNATATAALPLPKGVDDNTLRDAVEEYALALPTQPLAAATVPDLVGLAWLQQIAARDPSKREMVSGLMERLRLEAQDQYADGAGDNGEQVDIYDTLCDLAAQALACKYAVVSLVDENRQWFKSAVNVREADVPRDFSFCEYPVRDQRPLVVMDTLHDPRLRHHPFVTGPLAVRFLAGAPLFTLDNECVGAVCVLDTEPRHALPEHQVATMQNLAHLAMVMVQERREAQAKVARAAATATAAAAANSQLVVPAGVGSQQLPYPPPYYQQPPQQQPMLMHQSYPHPYPHPQQPSPYYQQPTYSYAASPLPAPPSASSSSSDMVPLSSSSLVVQGKQAPPREDPMLKEQMIQLLHKASQVRDQVSLNAQQQAGLQSSGE